MYGEIEIIRYFVSGIFEAFIMADIYEIMLLKILIFLTFISCDLFLYDFLPNKLISNLNNIDSLEKFAREKYKHKKNNETILIVE